MKLRRHPDSAESWWRTAPPGRGAGRRPGLGAYLAGSWLAVAGPGNVCGATLVTGAVSMIGPDGRLLARVAPPEPDPFVTNICFAGAGSHTAWITSSGRGLLYRCRWPERGLDLAFSG